MNYRGKVSRITRFDRTVGLVAIDDYLIYRHMVNIPAKLDLDVSVEAGEVLGQSGDAGAPGSNHLHFSIGDVNPLLVEEFLVPDTYSGEIASPYVGDTSTPFYVREAGKPDIAVKNGGVLSSKKPEFIVNAFDRTNFGSFVGFYRIRGVLDGKVIKEHLMNEVESDDNTFSIPAADTIYASGGSLQTVRGAPYFYRLGIQSDISEGAHKFCAEGFDLSNGIEGVSAPSTCVDFLIASSTPVITWGSGDGYWVCSSTIAGSCGTEAEPLLVNDFSFAYRDDASGLKELKLYKNNLSDAVFTTNTWPSVPAPTYSAQMLKVSVPDGKYVQTITNNLGNTVTMYFQLDATPPSLSVDGITINSTEGSVFFSGQATDAGSGLVQVDITRSINTTSEGTATFNYDHVSTGSYTSSSGIGGIGTNRSYDINAYDRIWNKGGAGINVIHQYGTSETGGSVVWQHITGIHATGEPCDISITATPNTFFAPVTYIGGITSFSAHLTPPAVFSADLYMPGRLSIAVSQRYYTDPNGVVRHENDCNPWLAGDSV